MGGIEAEILEDTIKEIIKTFDMEIDKSTREEKEKEHRKLIEDISNLKVKENRNGRI